MEMNDGGNEYVHTAVQVGGRIEEEAVSTDLNDELAGGRSSRIGTYPAPAIRMKRTRGYTRLTHNKCAVRCEWPSRKLGVMFRT
jgi:hypothetical protein